MRRSGRGVLLYLLILSRTSGLCGQTFGVFLNTFSGLAYFERRVS